MLQVLHLKSRSGVGMHVENVRGRRRRLGQHVPASGTLDCKSDVAGALARCTLLKT
jgi:hypothetical protein